MRSIHKKPLKRLLSTVLAIAMVLSLMPATVFALPAEAKAGQVSGSWTNYDAQACVLTTNVQPNTTGDTQSTTVYVDITPTFTSDTQTLKLTIGTEEIVIGDVTTDGSGYITTPTTGSSGTTTGGITYTIGFNTTPNPTKLEVTATNVPLVGCSTSGWAPVHPKIAININDGTAAMMDVTVPRKADLTVTATPDTVTAGEDFTVSTVSDIAEGYVKFTYAGEDQRVAVIPDENGNGIASATFTATGTAGTQTVTALQYAMTGVVNTTATKNITVNAAPVVHTITFDGNAVDAYHVPAAGTVADHGTYLAPDKPARTGYTFVGWSTDSTRTAETFNASTPNDYGPTDDITDVTGDMTLYAVWTKNTVTLTWPTLPITGVTSITQVDGSALDATAPEGSTVTFKVTVTDGYDVSTMVVTAGGVALAPVATGTANVYQFSFVANADTLIYVSPLQLTPVYHSITFLPGAVDAYIPFSPTTVSVKQGDSYPLPAAIPTREGYTFKGWDSDGNSATVEYSYTGSAYTTSTVTPTTADMTLNAVWEVEKVAVTLATGTPPTGVTLNSSPAGMKDKGSTVYFTLTVAAGYDPSTLVVTANGVALAAVKSATSSNMYLYSFVADAATEVAVSAPTKYQYTVTLPVGDHFTAKFDTTGANPADSETVDKVEHGSNSATFTVTAAADWTVDGVYANGVELTATAGKYQVTNVTANTVVTISMKETVWRTVTYFLDGAGMYAQVQVADGTTPTLLTVPSVEGYTVSGWYTGPDYGTEYTAAAVTKDLSLYAKKVAKTFDITFNMNAGTDTTTPASIDKVVKTYGQAAQLPSTVPTRTGYTFLGWGLANTDKVAAYAPGATFSAEITGNKELFAIWQTNTYTVTLPTGTGYSISTSQSTTVEHGKNFTFTVTVDRNYSTTAPAVSWTKADGTGVTTLTNPDASPNYVENADGSKSYTYTIANFTEDRVVSVTVKENLTYTVKFYTYTNDTSALALYLTQQVEDTYRATQPAAPVMEGYTFDNWYVWTDNDSDDTIDSGELAGTAYNFSTAVTGNLALVGKMTKNTYQVTWPSTNTTGWTMAITAPTQSGGAAITTSPFTVNHGTEVKFTVTVKEGYDASAMQVGVNGKLWAADSITPSGNDTVYTYTIPAVTETTTITVVGVVRKTVTITYNANARDDVSDMPEQQVVNYYLSGASGNSKIINQIPVRTGYTFLGWNTNSNATAADTKYTKAKIEANNAIAEFTTDTTLYAIWEANSTTITLAVSDVAVAANGTENAKEYEGQPVTLTATLSPAVSTGSVNFYQSSDNGTTWTVISSQSANGSDKYTFEATTGAYSGTDTYKAAYKAEGDEGYSDSTSTPVSVDRLSTTITWKLSGDAVDGTVAYGYASTLTITPDGGSALTAGTPMTAGQTYTLTAPAVYELGTDYTTALTVGTDYTITWQYLDGANGWKTLAENQTTSDYQVTSQYSKYQFRALMVVNTGDSTVYTKAAKFASEYYGARQAETMSCLISEPTPAVALQQTKTTLAITGAVEEAANQVLFGATKFGWGNHLVQYENQTVTLKATVTDNATDLGVNSVGKVYFYRYTNDGVDNNDVLLNANGQGIEVGPDGIATMNYTMPDYDSTKAASDEENCSRIYAVYVEGVTYDTSASVSFTTDTLGAKTYGKPSNGLKNMVFSKSTTIKTPVIDSARTGKLNGADATYTSYDHDLTELLAGVSHTFTLRTGNAVADWSVVALDGRTVADTNYDIQWNVKTGDNTETSTTVGGTFTTTDNKVGDEISVTLNPKGDMTKGATSKKAIIGTKQDVNVTVTASDEITSTPETDVYQLNEITLTATVAAKETNATVKPSGTVTFYYSVDSGSNWTKIGETTDLAEVSGAITASIRTPDLPVNATTNKQQNVTITAIYSGDSTFNESGTISGSAITTTTTGTVTNEEVTVYSSVVYVDAAENTTNTPGTDGITISAEEGKVLANETNVNLMLSDVYTLDHNIDLSKLVYGVDYTVQWQKLVNAASYSSVYAAADTPWVNIDGATNTTCQITVEQGAAYRAVITVKDTPIAKGSYTFVDQGTLNTVDNNDGRQVYYSNILVANPAPATVTVNVNTSNTTDGYEGIVEGETVTIHTFASGATGTTPISELTVTITDANGDVVNEQVKTNVNGHVSFDWTAAKPGYYELKVVAKFTNGYSDKTITRTLIVRDNDYQFAVSGTTATYDGKVKGLTVTVDNMGIESPLAQKSVVVYYYDKDGKQVEPTQVGTYTTKIRLQESAYWTELVDTTYTLTIEARKVSIEDVVVQAKVYDGTNVAYVQEIILKDADTNSVTGLPSGTDGIINGDSVYVTGTAVTDSANVEDVTKVTVTPGALQGKDAANYELTSATYEEPFQIQRSQVQGDIADATYKYGTTRVPAEDIYLIDQAGTVLGAEDYTVTYYYHSGNGVKQVSAMNWKGMYTVIARPDQDNYKGGAAQTIYVADAAVDANPVKTAKSALISITNTVELFGDANNQGIQATATKGTAVVKYNVGDAWVDTAPTAAGRYLVKVTAEENSAVIGTAYGLYTVVKTYPDYSIEAADADYNSAQYAESNITTNVPAGTYFTYTGGTIQGVAYEAPTEVGTYVVTAHIPEGTDAQGTVAHEISDTFEIKPIALKITADSLQRRQYGAFPDMTASFDGLATGGVAVDTSLRDVQIQPELIFNAAYSNDAMDQVGSYTITPVAALARNYVVKVEDYVPGIMTVTADEPNPVLAIHGMIDSSDGEVAYYGDKIQLYAYGSQNAEKTKKNNSSVLDWSVTGPATISPDGLLEITGVGTVVVTLKRGIGAQQIETTLTIDARKQEVKVEVPNVDLVYTGADRNYSGVGTPKAIDAKLTDVAVSDITVANNVRGVIGGQIVTGVVVDDKHQSETYGGLFTINDAEIVVAPKAVSTTYGTAATMSNVYDIGYTETTRVAGGTAALTGAAVASIADAYSNLDASTYEILVAGRENINYNVKYTTNPNAKVVTVTALENTLKYKTGVIADSTGRTNGYLQAADKFYPDEGAVVTYADPTVEPNDRMYGEPNPAMNYLFTGLITGDSAADLVELIELVGFVPGIDAAANRAFIADDSLTGAKSTTVVAGLTENYTTTTALQAEGVKNYVINGTNAFTHGYQNVYQRPFTLKLTGNKTELKVYQPLILTSGAVDASKVSGLLQLIKDNTYVDLYKGEGGLATKLGHTDSIIDLQIVGTPTYDSATKELTVNLVCGNTNYWMAPIEWKIKIDPSMIRVSYGTLGKYSSSVTMYGFDEHGNNIGAIDVTGKVWYEIYVEDTSLERKYSNYKDLTPVVRVQMTKGSGTGVYVANYNSTPLSAGHYVMFAIAEDYTIIE